MLKPPTQALQKYQTPVVTTNKAQLLQTFNLNNGNLQEFIDSNEFDANILVCCYHGMSSQSAAAFLCDRGFENVYSIDGGFERWALAFPDHCEKG